MKRFLKDNGLFIFMGLLAWVGIIYGAFLLFGHLIWGPTG